MKFFPKNIRSDILLIFSLLFITFSYFTQNKGPNENARFALIFSLVEERHVYIDNYYELEAKTSDVAFYNDHYYSDKAIGPSVLGSIFYTPIYFLMKTFNFSLPNTGIKWILTILVIGLPSALAGSLMYLLCYWIMNDRLRAYIITLAVTLGTMYLPFSTTFFSHQLTASLLFCAFFLIFILKERPEHWKAGYFFLLGLLLGWALISEFTSAIIVISLAVFFFYVIWRNPKYQNRSSMILLILGGVIPVLLQLIYNKLSFGNYFSLSYSHLETRGHWESALQQGFMGINFPNLKVLYYMTLHPLMGVFWMSPVLLISLTGAFFIFNKQQYQIELILSVWIICSLFILMSGYVAWWGGSSVGPRYIIPAIPFFSLLLIFVPKRFNWAIISFGLVSVFQMIIIAASNMKVPDGMVINIDKLKYFEYSNIYDYCLKLLIDGKFARNLGNFLFGLETWPSLIPLFLVIIGFTFYFFRREIKFLLSK